MTLQVKPGTSWAEVHARAQRIAPEAFSADEQRLANLVAGQWRSSGDPGESVSPVDGTPVCGPPRVGAEEALEAVATAAEEHKRWGDVPLAERRARVTAPVDAMAEPETRDTLALLLAWEIGSPGGWPAPTSTAASTASGGTSGRSTGSWPAARRCPGRSATSRAGATR